MAWRLGWPLAAAYLAFRSLRQPEYRQHWRERFLGIGAQPQPPQASLPGHSRPRPAARRIYWIHAVSVGETRAAQPLIERLAADDPEARFVLTHMTPTGRAAGAELAQRLAGRLVQRYLPYDLPGAVRRFFAETAPSIGVLIETETWPNLLAGAQAAAVPVLLVNARLSERSLARAGRTPRLIRATASRLARVVAQTEADAGRIRQFYDGPVDVTGNLKFDLEPPAAQVSLGRAWRAALAPRPIWLFANTRDGEEALLLDAIEAWQREHRAAEQEAPQARAPQASATAAVATNGRSVRAATSPLLLFVPRHPQRFDAVARLIAARGHVVVRRSDAARFAEPRAAGEIVLGDTMGEMAFYYAAADIALVGGSLEPLGGHNLIEACACGCAVILGPHTFNFAQASADAIAAGAALRVADAAGVLAAFAALSADTVDVSDAANAAHIGDRPRLATMRQCAAEFARAHRGATARTATIIERELA